MRRVSYRGRGGAGGMTLIEVLFGIGFILIAFGGFFALFQISIEIVSASKAKAGAIALANERMETVRSLPYDSVGTQGGIPSGGLAQMEAISLNATEYTRRTLIQYVDAPQDGLGGADENGITTDHKRVKVELTWSVRGIPRSYALVSTVTPRGVESVAGGGTLSIQVFDAYAAPVGSASVRILNTSGTSTIDVITYTNSSGIVLFPGTPSGSNYEITVGKTGYSSAQTYAVTVGNPNPSPRHLSIATGQTTSASFAIDRLAAHTVRTWEAVDTETWSDSFADDDGLVEMASTTVSGGAITLTDTSGYAHATSVSPTYLASWKSASWSDTKPEGSSILYRLYGGSAGAWTLLPDTALPGNAAGFTTAPLDLSGVPTSTYPALSLRGALAQGSAGSPPSIELWEVAYERGPVPLPSLAFSMRGSKTIGTDSGGASIYKFDGDFTTDGSGAWATTTLEWDSYALSIDPIALNRDLAESCLPQPTSVSPGSASTTDLFFVPRTAHSLLVSVRNVTSSALVAGASVRLYRTGVNVYATTSPCGQTFFPGLSSGTISGGNAYSLEVSKQGFATETIPGVEISGASSVTASLEE